MNKKKNGIVGSLITVFILILLVFLSNLNINNFSKAENYLNKFVMPFQNVYISFKNNLFKKEKLLDDVDGLKQEIQTLTEKNKELQIQIDELQVIKAENKILREYAGLGEQYAEHDFTTAYIINKDISNISNIFVINVGTDDGVYENMPVMSKDGVVGHIISSTKNTSKVQLIIDSASKISAQILRSRDNVLVEGKIDSNNSLNVLSMQADTDFIVGDEVETSGLGGIYPKGIKIGTIKEVVEKKNVIEKYAVLETTVDFGKLEYVIVVKK